MKEKYIEKKTCQRARDRGWKVRKNSSPNQRAALDRIFHKEGMTCYIEFKSPGGRATELQKIEMQELTDQLIPNLCCDNVDEAVAFLDSLDPDRLRAVPGAFDKPPEGA